MADLLPIDKIPAARWAIQPCHAVLHRTADYPTADYELFEKYPYPVCNWAKLLNGSKLGGAWELRGELDDPKTLCIAYACRACEDGHNLL